MGTITATFFWQRADNKCISFMIIDNAYRLRVGPISKKLNYKNFNFFTLEAEKIIKQFFQEIESLRIGNQDKIVIERKILNPIPSFLLESLHPSSFETEFVNVKFMDYFHRLKEKNPHVQLNKQLRKKLSGKALSEFKNKLYALQIISTQKNNAYQWHLWALALHVTNSNYQAILRKLSKTLSPTPVVSKGKRKRHAA